MNLPCFEGFSPQQRCILRQEIDYQQFGGVIPKSIVDKLLCLRESIDVDELTMQFLPMARHYAHAATSGFSVGAVARGESGALYLGANLEIRGESLGNSIHAEQSVVNNALLHQELGITHIATTHAPCGHCRQFLNEINDAQTINVMVLGAQPTQLKELLPEPFGPQDLGSCNPLFKPSVEDVRMNKILCRQLTTSNGVRSYAPHTRAFSAVSLQVDKSTLVGVYIENAAYNPSLSPLLSALDRFRFNLAIHNDYQDEDDRLTAHNDFQLIEQAVLVEFENAVISQKTHVSSLLSSIAPKAKLSIRKIPVAL